MMHSSLLATIAVSCVGGSAGLFASLYFSQDKPSPTLLWLRQLLRSFFVLHIVLCFVFGASFYIATHRVPTFELAVLLITGFFLQIFVQVRLESRIKGVKINPWKAQWDVLRHWTMVLLGLILLLSLNGVVSFLLVSMARQFNFSELAKGLILWLQAPIAIYSCQIIFESLRLPLLKYQFHARSLKDQDLRNEVQNIAKKFELPLKEIYLIGLESYGVNLILGCKSRLFVSKKLLSALDTRDVEFLIVHGLIDSQMNLERQRILNYTVFSLGLVFPYFLAGQSLDYILPSLWALTVWKVLAVALFLSQFLLKRSIDSLQFAIKALSAAKRVGVSLRETTELYAKINGINQVDSGPKVILGLPQAPALSAAREKHLLRARSRLRERPQILISTAKGLAGATAVLFVVALLILGPRYKLRSAAARGDLASVSQRLDQGMSPDSVDILSNVTPTPLLAAAETGKTEMVELLLNHHANPNKKVPLPFSPLIMAAKGGHIKMVASLIAHGAKVDYRGYKGLTALMWAAAIGHTEMIELLLKNGAQINQRSDHKSTALMLAIQQGQIPAANLLIERGADVRLRDSDHDSAMDLAKRKHLEIVEALIQRAESESRRRPASH